MIENDFFSFVIMSLNQIDCRRLLDFLSLYNLDVCGTFHRKETLKHDSISEIYMQIRNLLFSKKWNYGRLSNREKESRFSYSFWYSALWKLKFPCRIFLIFGYCIQWIILLSKNWMKNSKDVLEIVHKVILDFRVHSRRVFLLTKI